MKLVIFFKGVAKFSLVSTTISNDRVFTIVYVTCGFVFVYGTIASAVDAFFESVMRKVIPERPNRERRGPRKASLVSEWV